MKLNLENEFVLNSVWMLEWWRRGLWK